MHTSAFAKGNPKYASIVMDADTGLILHQRYANKSLHPASLTKVMTLLLTFEALEQGRISLNDRVRISNHAANMVPSKLGLSPGSSIRVKDAIYALVTKSANDVAVALAEHLAGSERNFAQRMTLKAHDIGMTRTTFVNASGLHDERQVSTARDMAKMARYVIQVYPEYYRYFS
ncbi:MAG TPA: D-alanyl-D-alanine carboxypeptidase family protein, partial [Alphaproteobacteria bacterium]|nr:D-alanyl-D-alanine carboxypeptidase family protein [Alphaproteobacteria bacterium]